MPKVYIKRGTASQIGTAKSANSLAAGELYLITDRQRVAVGTGAASYIEQQPLSPIVQTVAIVSGALSLDLNYQTDVIFSVELNQHIDSDGITLSNPPAAGGRFEVHFVQMAGYDVPGDAWPTNFVLLDEAYIKPNYLQTTRYRWHTLDGGISWYGKNDGDAPVILTLSPIAGIAI